MEKPQDVETYISTKEEHRDILNKLRNLILKHPFDETIKWGMPTYVYKKRNLIGIGAFKQHVGMWFFQGALLKDEHGLLHNAQEGKTKAMRQAHFSSAEEIDLEILDAYLRETVENEDKGNFVKIERGSNAVEIPVVLREALNGDPELKERYNSLTPGRQKEYAEHIGSAKRHETKARRLKSIIPLILEGKGLNDKYKN